MQSSGKFCCGLYRLTSTKLLWEPYLAFAPIQQVVRWRKRRNVPKAPSKIGRVRIPTPIDPKEYIFLEKKYAEYRVAMGCLRDYFRQEVERREHETAEGISTEEVERKAEEEWQALLAWNEEENRKVRAQREARIAEEHKLKEEEKLEALMNLEKQDAEQLREYTELVKQETEASKSFVTMENLDEAIDAAIDKVQNYNFTMDRSGEVTLPEDTSWLEYKMELEAKKEEAEKMES